MTATIFAASAGRGFGRSYWRAVATETWSDRWFHGIVLGYALAAGILALAIGAVEKLHYFEYAAVWVGGVAGLGFAYVALVSIPASIIADPKAPFASFVSRLPNLVNPRLVAAAVMVLGMVLLKGAFTSVKNMLPDLAAFRWDVPFAAMDAALSGGRDPWRLLQPLLGHHAVTRTIQVIYTAIWLLAVCSVPAVVAASRRLAPLRTRFFITYLFCWIVLGNILAGVFMSAGPVYFGEVTGDFERFAPQLDYLSATAGHPYSSFDLQQALWRHYQADRVELGTGISAFPSLHVAMATLFFLAGLKVHRYAALAGGLFLLIIMLGSVHLAWHYAVDGYASMLAVCAVWFGVGWVQRRAAR